MRTSRVAIGLTALMGTFGAIVPTVHASPSATASAHASVGCDVAALQAVSDKKISPDAATVTIVSAVQASTPAPVVAYCRVDGFVVTEGPGPTPNQVKFMVALPEVFNNRYFFVGVGGSAGSVPSPPAIRLREGFAVAGTDGGSPTPGVDWRFAIDRTKAFDYGQRGVHVSAIATQRITEAYYDLRGPDDLFTYISGCSGGGRMGNAEASTYPRTFDGVILGAPGIDPQNILTFGTIADMVIENPNAWVSPGQLATLQAAVVAQFDDADGAHDGLVWDSAAVTFDPASLGIFNDDQLALLDILINGLDLPGGQYPGFGLANPIGWSSFIIGLTLPPWDQPGEVPPAGFLVFDSYTKGLYGLDYNFVADFQFDDKQYVLDWRALFDDVYAASGEADSANLKQFQRAGGKVLIWHGVADNAISFNDTLEWFAGLEAITPHGDVGSWARLFPVPGMNHCGGGIGPSATIVETQALAALVAWVEGGTAPDSLVASNATRSFRLCPYPQRSVFAGGVANPSGLNVNDAANWTCE